MGFNLNLKQGVDESLARIKSPFDRFRNSASLKTQLLEAQRRKDFDFFEIVEIIDGREAVEEKVLFIGSSMPHQPFNFGGSQKIVKDYYPGNSEPTVQVLGPRENNIVIKGRLKAKQFRDTSSRFVANPNEFSDGQTFREYPAEQQQLIEAMRIRGNVVKISMGEFQRWGFIEESVFNMKTLADIDYEITFSIIGFNPPSNLLIVNKTRTIPFDINKNLISASNEFLTTYQVVPDSMPLSLAEQINENIAVIAEAIALVTDFVDGVLNEVDSLKASLARAKGLVLNARASISTFNRRIGAFDPTGGVSQQAGVASSYENASYLKNVASATFSLMAFLAGLQAALAAIAETEPLGRHRVVEGDTLQKIAVKFYNDSSQWKEIYDHNKLQSTQLTNGVILEIPRVT